MPRAEKLPKNLSELSCTDHTCTDHTCTDHTCTDHTCTNHTCTDHTCTDHACLHRIPSPTSQALMMMKGVEIFIDPDLKQETPWQPPVFAYIVCQSSMLPHKPREMKDQHTMVSMVPKNAILLTVLMDGDNQVYFCTYVFDKDKNSVENHWWKASSYALDKFQFQHVFSANSIFHAWLHYDKKNQINLGVFDTSVINHEITDHMKIEQRSGILHEMFCQAVQQHQDITHLSWVWVGQLGHDQINENNTFTSSCGACDVIRNNNWCFEIDYLLQFPSPNEHSADDHGKIQSEYNIVQAKPTGLHEDAQNKNTEHPRKKFKGMSITIP